MLLRKGTERRRETWLTKNPNRASMCPSLFFILDMGDLYTKDSQDVRNSKELISQWKRKRLLWALDDYDEKNPFGWHSGTCVTITNLLFHREYLLPPWLLRFQRYSDSWMLFSFLLYPTFLSTAVISRFNALMGRSLWNDLTIWMFEEQTKKSWSVQDRLEEAGNREEGDLTWPYHAGSSQCILSSCH